MTPTEVKQAADEMVEVFGPYMAIEHCKRVIEEFGENVWMVDSETTNIQKNRLILSELEGRVK